MTIRTLTLAAVTALVAGAAGAQAVNPGDIQLALKAGVQPGAYSTAQLIRLLDAQHENQTARIDFILRETNDAATRMDVSMPADRSTATFGSNVNSENH